MEETTATEGDAGHAAGVTASIMGDADAAQTEFVSVHDDIQAAATEDSRAAYLALSRLQDELSGVASVTLDAAEQPVIKYVAKLADAAAKDHQSAISDLITAGARPLYVTTDMVADMDRGDVTASAVEQILSPIADASAPQSVDPVTYRECPTGYELATGGTDCRWAGPADIPPVPFDPVITSPPPPPPVVVPPSEPGACPGITINIPACPSPAAPTPADVPFCDVPPVDEAPPTDEPTTDEPEEVAPIPVPDEPTTGQGAGGDWGPPPPEAPPVKPGTFRPTAALVVPDKPGAYTEWNSAERCGVMAQRAANRAGLTVDQVQAMFRADMQSAILADAAETDELRIALAAQDKQLDRPITRRQDAFADWVKSWIDAKNAQAVTQSPADFGAAAAITAAQLLDKYAGGPWDYLVTGSKYDLQYSSPQYLPSQDEVDNLYLTGVIGAELWGCLTQANGHHLWARTAVVSSKRAKPGINGYIELFRRGALTRGELEAYAAQSGVLSKDDLNAFLVLTDFVPPYTDLIRLMVRDSADMQIVNDFGYDIGFEQKFTGPIKAWAHSQGISEDVFRYLWRAHWQLPSPTQLYEMLHRLRPGRVPAGTEVTAKDVRQTLLANDLAPAFVDRLMAVSYNVVTRTDLLTFFTNGSMGKAEVIERLQDTGYSRDDAARIADAWEVEVANRQSNRSRVWSRTNIGRAYREGSLTRLEADDLFGRTITDPAERARILDDNDTMRAAQTKAKCVKAARKRFLAGELSTVQARDYLGGLGLDVRQRVDLVDGWSCELTSMDRAPTVTMLSDWFVKGIIGLDEFNVRLVNLHYKPLDAQRIIQSVIMEEQERRAKAAAAAARQAKADDERRRKEAERLAEKRKKEAAAALKSQGQ